jgi:tol-pal system protein YbgF
MYKLQDDVSGLKREVSDLRVEKERREKIRKEMGISGPEDISDAELELRKELASIRADMDSFRGEINTFQGFIDETRYRIRQDQLATKEKINLNERRIFSLESKFGGPAHLTPPPGKDSQPGKESLNGTPKGTSSPPEKGKKVFTSEREVPTKGQAHFETPEELYDHALGMIKNGQFRQGRKALEEFATSHQDHRLMPNVFYWRGETFYAEKDYESAAITFQEVIDRYPSSPKAPDALYKQGFCFLNMRDPVSAKAAFKLLLSKYPTSIAAGKAKAKLREMGEKGGG